ncbi:MAG TPA: GtrA family protein, partial [Opitutaceae bacterium]
MSLRDDGTAMPRSLLGIPANVFRFGVVGVTVAVVFAALNAFFAKVCGLGPQLSFLAAYPPALCLHFLLNKVWTFGDRARTSHHQVGEYLYSVLVTFLIQWPAFEILHGLFGLRGWIAALGANLLQMTASYLLLRTRVFAGREPAQGENPWTRIAVVLAAVGGMALIYWTCMAGWGAPGLNRTEHDYYNDLVHGFRKGSLAMDMPVPEALKKSPNPWDPAVRPPGVAAHDVSYYNGKYYLYFGVVPAVLFFWPFRALTGYDLPFTIATTSYLCAGFLVAAWLWLRILRERFASSGAALRICGVLVLGLAGGQLGLARRNSIWEMPISAGTFYVACLSAAVYLAITGRRRLLSLAAAGLCLGLAIGCRPTLAAAGPALGFVVLWSAWEGRRGRPFLRSLAAPLAASAAPFAAVFGSLLEYNYLRFGKFTEFGLNFQMTGNYEAKAEHFQLRFLPYNFRVYFIKPPQWGRYFPFFHPFSWIQQPKGYYGTEFVYGAFVVCPVLLGIAAALVLAWRRRASAEGATAAFFLLAAAGISGMLCCFNTAASRYEADFLPMCLWLALLGWAWLSSSPGVRTAGAWAVSVLS